MSKINKSEHERENFSKHKQKKKKKIFNCFRTGSSVIWKLNCTSFYN